MDWLKGKDRERKKKIAKIFAWIGVILIILGILPWTLSLRAGLVWGVFAFVFAGLAMVAIPDPDPEREKYDPEKEDPNDVIPKPPE